MSHRQGSRASGGLDTLAAVRARLFAAATAVAAVALSAPPGALGSERPPSWAAARRPAPLPGRTVVVVVDGTTLNDWSADDLPTFGAVLRRSGVAVLGTWTGDGDATVIERRARAVARLIRRDPATVVLAGPAEDEGPGPYGAACAAPSNCGRFLRADRTVPTGARTDLTSLRATLRTGLARASTIVVDLGDAARADRELGDNPAARAPWTSLAMRRADAILASLLTYTSEIDRVMLLSAVAPTSDENDGIRLGAFAIADGDGARLLRGSGTRRDGFITLDDVARALRGERIDARPANRATQKARALDATLRASARARRAATRGALAVALLLVAFAVWLVTTGRGAPPGAGPLPRTIRDITFTLILAAMSAPAGLLLIGASPPETTARTVAGAAATALALAISARAFLGRRGALMAVLSVTALLPIADALGGGVLSHGSTLAVPLASGARLRGADAALASLAAVALVFVAALILDVGERVRARAIPLGLFCLVAVAAMGTHRIGNTPGIAIVALPAMVVVLARTIDPRRAHVALGALAATVFGLGSLAILAPGGHAAFSAATGVARARIDQTVALLPTAWPLALLASAAPIAALIAKHRSLIDRASWGRPHLRAALATTPMAATAAMIGLDGGLMGAAWIALTATATTAAVLLVPDA